MAIINSNLIFIFYYKKNFSKKILAIGKAFSVLSDAQKRKQYDNYGPEAFNENSGGTPSRSTHGYRSHHGTHYSWNEEEFSADELFNLFFGGSAAHTRRRQNNHQQARAQEFNFSSSSVNKCLLYFNKQF